MGITHSGLTEEELTEYEELTFLTRREVMQAWSVWKKLVKVPEHFEDKTLYYPAEVVLKLPELEHNPFKDQIARHFGRREPNTGETSMNFENFLDLLHVMNPKAPLQLKAHYAFKLFDFNEDTILDEEDLTKMLNLLTDDQLTEEPRTKLIKKLLEETDMEGDGAISEEEFKHLLTKCLDFTLSFRFTI